MQNGDVLAALQRSDDMLVAACRRLYVQSGDHPGEYRGLFISDQEFLELLERPFGQPPLGSAPLLPKEPGDSPRARDDPLLPKEPGDSPRARDDPLLPKERGDSSRARDDPPDTDPWHRLVYAFGLSPFEADALLLCLLPELDLKYDRILAYLQDDVTAKRPSVDLVLNLLCPTLVERIAARSAFEPTAPLSRYGLVQIAPPHEGPDALLRRTVAVAPDVVSYLLTNGSAPATPAPYWAAPGEGLDLTVYPPDQQALIERLIVREPQPLWVHVHSQERWSAVALAQDLAAQRNLPLLRLPLETLLSKGAPIQAAVRDAVRHALLTGAVLAVSLPGQDHGPEELVLPAEWDALLRAMPITVILDAPGPDGAPLPEHSQVALFDLPLARPGYQARKRLWERALAGVALDSDADLAELAGRYRLEGAQIGSAAQSARALARQRDPERGLVSFGDLSAGARAVSSVRLGKLAQQITPRRRWEELVLPPDRLAQIVEMCSQYRYRHIVYDDWGLGARSSRGQGLSALFAGPSGTGKTMAAEVIANDLALDLFKIDLSGVVSKYIGETEKNLDRIFDLARDSNAILLFDEADALFGKRSETKDAHDRYANIEISYLLQKVEEYDGVVILTSNLRQNLDEAFMRRLQFSIEFPFPEREARLLIWQRSAPPDMPLAPRVDWELLADRFRLSGGSIRNALVTAAFLAARADQPVGMAHLLWGIRREFQKLGKLIDEDEFAPLGVGAVERVSRRRAR